jgi:hypothetical protein
MESAHPVLDQNRLSDLLNNFAKDSHVGWKKGDTDQVYNWFNQCATKDIGRGKMNDCVIYGLELPYQKYGIIVIDTIPKYWENYNVVGFIIQIGVCGAYHIIGKAKTSEFFYLEHK